MVTHVTVTTVASRVLEPWTFSTQPACLPVDGREGKGRGRVKERDTGFLSIHHLHCNSVHSANCATSQAHASKRSATSWQVGGSSLTQFLRPPFTTPFGGTMGHSTYCSSAAVTN